MGSVAHDGDDLFDRRRVSRVALTLVRGGNPARNRGVVAGERRRPAASSNGRTVDMAPSLGELERLRRQLYRPQAVAVQRSSSDALAPVLDLSGRLRSSGSAAPCATLGTQSCGSWHAGAPGPEQSDGLYPLFRDWRAARRIRLTTKSTYVELGVVAGRRFSAQTLSALAALEKDPTTWRHGYELARETGLRSGTLYPVLIRLADRGLVQACWEEDPPVGRPRRHLYRLTPDGLAAARVALTEVPLARDRPGIAAVRRPARVKEG